MRSLAALLILALTPPLLHAQGQVIPRPCPAPTPGPRPLRCVQPVPAGTVERVGHDVRVDLSDRVLRYEITERFVNRGGAIGEADYVFPLPKGAAFQDLQLSIGEEMVSGEILDAREARQIYEEIVRRQRDPALVEFMGQGLLRARIFPIAPGEERRVIVRFQVVAEREGEALRVDYAAGSARRVTPDERQPAGRTRTTSLSEPTFTLRYADHEQFGTPYSPTHALDVRTSGERREVRVREPHGAVTVLLPVRHAARATVAMLAHRPDRDDGFALLTLTPPAMRVATTPRDVAFVIDVSGSMRGEKMEQARAAGRQLLATLRPQDRLRLIAFSSDVRSWRDGWTPATREHLRDAARFIDALDASGSTNISGALEEALDVPGVRGRLPIVLFLTDGEPTVGERDPARIASRAADLRDRARIFTFGVGHDLNAALLERLALEGRGTAHFVRPQEDVERAVSLVAARLTTPLVTDVRVTVEGGGVRLLDAHPRGSLDLFAGQDLVLLTRYRGSGAATVRVEGSTADGPVLWRTQLRFPERRTDDAFVARLWATQRIGWLSAERRRGGPNAEVEDEIRRLGMRYGIPTEYSSYLVLEPGMTVAGTRGRLERQSGTASPAGGVPRTAVRDAAAPAPPPATAPAAAEERFQAAREAAAQRAAVSMSQVDALAGRAGELTRRAGDRTFHLRGEVWTDSRHSDSLPVVRIRPFGESWFRLLESIPELREPFALGERVVVAGERVAVELSPDAPERVSNETLARIRRDW